MIQWLHVQSVANFAYYVALALWVAHSLLYTAYTWVFHRGWLAGFASARKIAEECDKRFIAGLELIRLEETERLKRLWGPAASDDKTPPS